MPGEASEIDALAEQVMRLAHDDILIHLRFFDTALSGLPLRRQEGRGRMATDGAVCYYDPTAVLREYKKRPESIARTLLHALLHCIFFHSFQYEKLDGGLWDLAADIAVENVVLEMDLPCAAMEEDPEALRKLKILREDAGALTAEKLYRYFRQNPPSASEREALEKLFCRDSHELWKPADELFITQQQWKKISERVKADLKSFTNTKTGAEVLEKNLEEATRERFDYGDVLRRFTVTGEDMVVNDDEFDYIYYTYGLNTYGNMPLVEPLEYREVNKVKEFVIAIDTSASCRGPVVKNFLRKTYSILKDTENFFQKTNVHIIQCDMEVRSDTKITCDEEFENFMRYGKLKGFGATDFRPVFSYVEELTERGEFENLKGLIYFTDGYGIYPEKKPAYDVIFAFLEEDERRMPVPHWALKLVLDSEGFEDEESG